MDLQDLSMSYRRNTEAAVLTLQNLEDLICLFKFSCVVPVVLW